MRYFTSLLSTGAGWKDKIDSAVILVNLHSIKKQQILGIGPSNYQIINDSLLVWEFKNLEPSIGNDIKIEFTPNSNFKKKTYTEEDYPTYVVDGTVMNDDSFINFIKPSEILNLEILKDEDGSKYTEKKTGVIVIKTFAYAMAKLNNMLVIHKQAQAPITMSNFVKNYKPKLNGHILYKEEAFKTIMNLKENQIKSITVNRKILGKTRIKIATQLP